VPAQFRRAKKGDHVGPKKGGHVGPKKGGHAGPKKGGHAGPPLRGVEPVPTTQRSIPGRPTVGAKNFSPPIAPQSQTMPTMTFRRGRPTCLPGRSRRTAPTRCRTRADNATIDPRPSHRKGEKFFAPTEPIRPEPPRPRAGNLRRGGSRNCAVRPGPVRHRLRSP